MKKTLRFVCIFLLTIMGNVSYAEERYPISQLQEVTSPTWQETYRAFGRTIEVNERIILPDVQAAPVILVRAHGSVQEPQCSSMKDRIKAAAAQDPENYYSFSTDDFSTCYYYGWPRLWDESKGYKPGVIGQQTHGLFDFDMNAAYADANLLTVGKAFAIAQKHLPELFPDMTMYLRNVALWDRTYWKENGDPISEKGFYQLECAQIFHGIPLMASIHNAFAVQGVGDENTWLDGRGLIRAEVMDEDSFSLTCRLYEEVAVLHEDISLLPFDAVKEQMEQMILSGYVRFVDSVQLGYVQFDTDESDTQMLVPCWVVWCQYMKEGAQDEPWHELYTDSLFVDNEYFKPIIFNGQTGEMIDPQRTDSERCQAPPILPR